MESTDILELLNLADFSDDDMCSHPAHTGWKEAPAPTGSSLDALVIPKAGISKVAHISSRCVTKERFLHEI